MLLFAVVRTLRLRKKYKEYLHIESALSGKEAVFLMMNKAGYETRFAIYQPQKITIQDLTNPFFGNFYFPDEDLFLMKREIMDKKTLLSLCVGCQLAGNALKYKQGKLDVPNATMLLGQYCITYRFDEEEIQKLVNLQSPIKNVD